MASLLICTYLEFRLYPGHSFLEGSSQLLAPMLKRVEAPGLLTRDLVATHPILRYTIYDEVTLFLERVIHLDLAPALAAQQLTSRLGMLTGVFLLVSAAGLREIAAIFIAAAVGLGAALPGICVRTADPEPVPYAISFGFVVLALGLLASQKVLLSSLSGGIALLYSPAIAAPFWAAALFGPLAVREFRAALRPFLTGFVVFGLLLANLAQLQPGAPGAMEWFTRASGQWLALLGERAPSALVTAWARELWLYAAIGVGGLCAVVRLWPRLNPASRWLFTTLPLAGLVVVPVAAIFERWLPLSFWIQLEPARTLLFTVLLTMILSGMAAGAAFLERGWREAAVWSAGVLALAVTPLLPFGDGSALPEKLQFQPQSLRALARWAEHSTWGGSMFVFADAGQALDPGYFRALSARPVYIDWKSRELIRYYEEFGFEWQARWQQLTSADSELERLQQLLPLPIDYYVFTQQHRLRQVQPVFANREVVVYDARDLRSARQKLVAAGGGF